MSYPVKKYKTSIKEYQLAFEALMSEAIGSDGHAHYGLFKKTKAERHNVVELGHAQNEYWEMIAGAVPKKAKTMLDVGSGTGSNARKFVEKGMSVDGLCPSKLLNYLARKKLPESSAIWDIGFEDFLTDKVYDVILCSESFHYIQHKYVMQQFKRYTEKNGSVIIFDYFLHDHSEQDERKMSHQGFQEMIEKDGHFKIVQDDDMTKYILPTFEVLGKVRSLIAEFSELCYTLALKERPVKLKVIDAVFGKKLKKFFKKRSNSLETFPKRFSYRFIKLDRIK